MTNCGYKTFTKLFETGVLSILKLYTITVYIELYTITVYIELYTVHYILLIRGRNMGIRKLSNTRYCYKQSNMIYFIDVHRLAQTAGMVGDMGWLSLNTLLCWDCRIRLIKMDDNRITRRIFLWIYARPDNTLSYVISRVANELNMSHVYNNKLLF